MLSKTKREIPIYDIANFDGEVRLIKSSWKVSINVNINLTAFDFTK